MSSIIEMEGYTFSVDGNDVLVRVNNKKSDKTIWRGVPTHGPVWNRVMKTAGVEVKVEETDDHQDDAIIDNADAPAIEPEAEPEVLAKPESKAARKRRLKAENKAKREADEAERDAAEAAAAADAEMIENADAE